MEVCEALDPQGMIIAGRIGREGTMLRNGVYIKDFSYLGRPIKEVVYIDHTDDVVPYHTENTILLPEWNGDADDRSLYDIIPFLESLSQKPVDVRQEIDRYSRDRTAEKFN
jgi:TFIIF-interacting CTD phosphatase-like protein